MLSLAMEKHKDCGCNRYIYEQKKGTCQNTTIRPNSPGKPIVLRHSEKNRNLEAISAASAKLFVDRAKHGRSQDASNANCGRI